MTKIIKKAISKRISKSQAIAMLVSVAVGSVVGVVVGYNTDRDTGSFTYLVVSTLALFLLTFPFRMTWEAMKGQTKTRV